MTYLVSSYLQGQYRAAASQAKVSTIPDDQGFPSQGPPALHSSQGTTPGTPGHNSTYMPMGLRKTVTPLATSSPSGIPRYTPDQARIIKQS